MADKYLGRQNLKDVAGMTVYDPSVLAAESLSNPSDFSVVASWSMAGEFAIAGTFATFTYAATGAGTVTQSVPSLAIRGIASRWYKAVYVISAAPTQVGGAMTITTAFASAATTLPITAGTNTVFFQSLSTEPGSFVINVTGVASGTFTIESFSLKEVTGGDITVNGAVHGTSDTSLIATTLRGGFTATDVNVATYPTFGDLGTSQMLLQDRYTGTGASTINLPSIATIGNGKVYCIMDSGYNAAVFNITLVPDGGDKINNVAANLVINVSGTSVTICANTATSNWEII